MAKFDNIMIVSDIDGTFFNDKSETVPKNLKAIDYFMQNGGHFAFSTGRNEEILLKIIPDASKMTNTPAILSNGSYIYNFETKERLYEICLPTEKARSIITAIEEKFPFTGVRFSSEKGFVTHSLEKIANNDLEIYQKIATQYTYDEIYSMRLNKVVFSAPAERIWELKDYANLINDGEFFFTISAPRLMEMMQVDSTKGKALVKLKDAINLSAGKVYAIGDYENDIDMLCAADVAVCPENAIDSVKAVADFIVCDNNSGAIADLINIIENLNAEQ